MSEKWVRASEIAEYVYCQRAWWLRQVRGYSSHNVRQLQRGTAYHEEHGRLVGRSVWLRRLAYALLFVLVAFITFQFLMS